MTCGHETLIVKRETALGKAVAHEASFVKRISFLKLDASRVTLHERCGLSQSGR